MGTVTKTITGNAQIKDLGISKTINSNMEIGWRKTINSDGHIKKIGISKTINSNAIIKKLGYEGSVNSNANIKRLAYSSTITLNSYIKKLAITKTLNSNSWFKRNYGNHALEPNEDMVSLYHMNEPDWSGVPNEVIDSKGSNHGAAMALATTTVNGLYNRGGIFTGVNTGINLGDSSTFHTSVLSISVWVYPTAASSDFNDVVNSGRYRITLRSTRYAQWWVYVDGVGWITAESDAAVTLNKWTLLVVTYDGTTAKLYVNGTIQSTTGTGVGTIPWAGNTVFVGQSGGDTNEFVGRMDDLAFSNVASTQTDISTIWKDFTYLYSNNYIKKLAATKTITSDSYIEKTATKTLTSDYHIKTTISKTITSNSIIKKLGYEGSIDEDAQIKKLGISKTINSNAKIKKLAYSDTITTDSYIKKINNTNTINSNAWILEVQIKTINSDYHIFATPSDTITSNSKIKKLNNTETIDLDSWIGETQSKTIDSDAHLFATVSKTINSNAKIKKLGTEGSIASDSYIEKTATKTITSDAGLSRLGISKTINSNTKIKKLNNTETITTDSYVFREVTNTITSDAHIKKLGISKTTTSDAFIQKGTLGGISTDSYIKKLGTTETITSDYKIKDLDIIESITSDAHIIIYGEWSEEWEVFIIYPKTTTIDLNYHIKKLAYSDTIDSNAKIKKLAYEGSITSDSYIKQAYSKELNMSMIIRTQDTTKPWVCAARYINKPIIVSANSLSYTETVATSYHPRKTITSDAHIKKVGYSDTINSNCVIN